MLLRLWKQVTVRMSAIRKQKSCAFMWCAVTHCSKCNRIFGTSRPKWKFRCPFHVFVKCRSFTHRFAKLYGLGNGWRHCVKTGWVMTQLLTQLREAVPNSKSCVAYSPPISTATLFPLSPSTEHHETRNTPLCQFDFDRLPTLWNLTTSCFWTPILLLQTSLNLKLTWFCYCAIVISIYFPIWSTSGFKEWAEPYSHGNCGTFMVLGFQNMLGHWQPPSKASPSQFLLRAMKISTLSQTSLV